MKKLLKAGCQPYFQMLEKWLCEGDLDDPFQEFMVCQDTVSAGYTRAAYFHHLLEKPALSIPVIPEGRSCRCLCYNHHLHSSYLHRAKQ